MCRIWLLAVGEDEQMQIDTLQEVWTAVILFLPRLGIAVLILFVSWILARIFRRAVTRFGRTRHLSPDVANLLEQITEVSLLVFGAVTALGTLGVDVAAIIAGLGLVGFALGFALRDLLSNFLAGMLILIYNPFIRGDSIKILDNEGKVIEINLRYTVLQTDDKRALIPNSILFSNPVVVKRQEGEIAQGKEAGNN
jgi:small-conductance mechanosensitive channel